MYPPPPATGTTAYRPPSYYAVTADPNRGLRAATRLASAADLLQGGAILWVDDHHQWNEPLVRLFRTAGMKVDTVGTTDEALRYLDRDTYDLVISDLRRERDPGDGVAGMALLDRMVSRGIPTPAVVFSDNPQVRTMSHPRAAATTNNPEELVDRVVDLVAHRRNALNQPQAPGRGGFFFGGN
jgi:DNA-binding NtrC family response regulator